MGLGKGESKEEKEGKGNKIKFEVKWLWMFGWRESNGDGVITMERDEKGRENEIINSNDRSEDPIMDVRRDN